MSWPQLLSLMNSQPLHAKWVISERMDDKITMHEANALLPKLRQSSWENLSQLVSTLSQVLSVWNSTGWQQDWRRDQLIQESSFHYQAAASFCQHVLCTPPGHNADVHTQQDVRPADHLLNYTIKVAYRYWSCQLDGMLVNWITYFYQNMESTKAQSAWTKKQMNVACPQIYITVS